MPINTPQWSPPLSSRHHEVAFDHRHIKHNNGFLSSCLPLTCHPHHSLSRRPMSSQLLSLLLPFPVRIMTNERLPGSTPPLIPIHDNGQNQTATKEGSIKSTSIEISCKKSRFHQIRSTGFARKCWAVVTWTPQSCRWNQDNPPQFSMGLNLLFGFVRCFLLGCHVFSKKIYSPQSGIERI